MSSELAQRQYAAWGVVVSNRNTVGAHIANGLVQLLRLAADPPSSNKSLGDYRKDLTARLRSLPEGGRLSAAGSALCVLGSKAGGPLALSESRARHMTDRHLLRLSDAGRAHALDRFEDATRQQPLPVGAHALIAGTLNADRRMFASGDDRGDPTTPGLGFAGRSSPHTLNNMHAATFLGLLCATQEGMDALRHIHRLLAGQLPQGQLPQQRLAELLGVSSALPPPHGVLPTVTRPDLYPCPGALLDAGLATLVGRAASNLVAWHQRGSMSGGAFWMAVVDLIGLVFVRYLLHWGANPSEPLGASQRPLLVVAPRSRRPAHRPTIAQARRGLQMACSLLDKAADLPEHDLVHRGKNHEVLPSSAARALGAATGWLRPARGGGARWPCPGPRQLTTLIYSTMAPTDGPLAWPELHEAVERQHGLVLGGVDERVTAARMGLPSATTAVRLAGGINQAHLVALGLARQDSDDVVVVDGGVL